MFALLDVMQTSSVLSDIFFSFHFAFQVTRCITVDDHLVKVKAEASYWDLEGHGDPDEAVMHLREILCGENVDWNQIHDHMMRTFHEGTL